LPYTTYFIQTEEGPNRICKEAFLRILSCGRSKFEYAAKMIMEDDEEKLGTIIKISGIMRSHYVF
ncbi:hypothetical protein L9F63_003899, partial [Diploptera punctata]